MSLVVRLGLGLLFFQWFCHTLGWKRVRLVLLGSAVYTAYGPKWRLLTLKTVQFLFFFSRLASLAGLLLRLAFSLFWGQRTGLILFIVSEHQLTTSNAHKWKIQYFFFFLSSRFVKGTDSCMRTVHRRRYQTGMGSLWTVTTIHEVERPQVRNSVVHRMKKRVEP